MKNLGILNTDNQFAVSIHFEIRNSSHPSIVDDDLGENFFCGKGLNVEKNTTSWYEDPDDFIGDNSHGPYLSQSTPPQKLNVINQKFLEFIAPESLDDKESYWATPYIIRGLLYGFFSGPMANPNFYGERKITRQEAVLVSYRAGKILGIIHTNTSGAPFNDVPSTSVFFEAIQSLKNAGIVSGEGNMFHGHRDITRGETVKIFAEGFGITRDPDNSVSFTDDDQAYTTFEEWIIALASNTIPSGEERIISGYSVEHFGANNNVLRSQVAKIVNNCFVFALDKQIMRDDGNNGSGFFQRLFGSFRLEDPYNPNISPQPPS